MEQAAKDGRARERGIELAARVIREMQGIAQGVHVMAIGGEAEVPEILRRPPECAKFAARLEDVVLARHAAFVFPAIHFPHFFATELQARAGAAAVLGR